MSMPDFNINFIFLCCLAFLLGSIPTGLLLGKLKGTDIRKSGSGNIGATNAFRTLGKVFGILTFIGDCLKGLPFICLAQYLGYGVTEQATLGFIAFVGHCYSPYLRFKGGKGVATGFAIFLYLSPSNAFTALAIFILTFFTTGIISISSLFSSLGLAISFHFTDSEPALQVISSLVALIIWKKHRDNILRLIKGKESSFNFGLRKLINKND